MGDDSWKADLEAVIDEYGNIEGAARALGVTPSRLYQLRRCGEPSETLRKLLSLVAAGADDPSAPLSVTDAAVEVASIAERLRNAESRPARAGWRLTMARAELGRIAADLASMGAE